MIRYVKWMELLRKEDVDRILLEIESGNTVIFSCSKLIIDDKFLALDGYITELVRECKARGIKTGTIGTFRGYATLENIIFMDLEKEDDVDKILYQSFSGNIVIFSLAKLICNKEDKKRSAFLLRLKNGCRKGQYDIGIIGFRGIICPSNVKVWRNL